MAKTPIVIVEGTTFPTNYNNMQSILLYFCFLLPWLVVAQETNWWEKGIIYQIYPRSFKDSNNDGIGDLPGITSALPYLADLGVAGVWLSPIYTSPMKDFGYDIANFTDVNADYGTLSDFDELTSVANSLGLKIIMDFVPNHSSDEHPWFEKSVNREDGYDDYYVWRDLKGVDAEGRPIPPNNWLSVFYGSAWEFNEVRGQFYLHQFAVGQPDLNYRNPVVVQEMKDVITFWLDRGVHGFRVDAIGHLFENPDEEDEPVNAQGPEDENDYGHLLHIYTKNNEETYDMVKQWRKLVDERSAEDNIDRCIMVEAYESIEATMKYFGTEEEPGAHFPFNFNFISINNATGAADFRRLINNWVLNVPSFGHNNWVIGNHDNHRVGSRIGEDLIDAMNVLMLSLPGVGITYYGEEIGMVDNLAITYDDGKDPNGCNYPPEQWYQRSRDFERTPFQWDDSVNAGFNEGGEPWLPINDNYVNINLDAEEGEPKSHYEIYRSMVELRKSPSLQSDHLLVQLSGDTLAVLRYANSTEYVVVLINFSFERSVTNLDELLLLGPNTTLYVAVTDDHSGLNVGTSGPSTGVPLQGRSVIVLRPAGL